MKEKTEQKIRDKQPNEYFYVYIADDWYVGWLPVRITKA